MIPKSRATEVELGPYDMSFEEKEQECTVLTGNRTLLLFACTLGYGLLTKDRNNQTNRFGTGGMSLRSEHSMTSTLNQFRFNSCCHVRLSPRRYLICIGKGNLRLKLYR